MDNEIESPCLSYIDKDRMDNKGYSMYVVYLLCYGLLIKLREQSWK